MVAPSCARRTRLCGFLLTALTTRLLCAPEQVLGAAPGATAPRASSDAVGFTTEDGDGDDGVEELAAGLGGLQLGDNVGEEQPEFYAGTDGSGHRMVECKHPGLTKLERCVGIVNSGHGDAKWMEKPKPSWFAKFPEEIFPNVMAFTGVDVRVGGGAGQIARVGDGRRLLNRPDVLGLLSTVRNPDEKWLNEKWRTVRALNDIWTRARQAHGRLSLGDINFLPRDEDRRKNMLRARFRSLCDVTSRLLGEKTGYGRGGPQLQQNQPDGTTTTISPALQDNPVQLRPGAQVRVKPWGSFGTRDAFEMEEYLTQDVDPQLLHSNWSLRGRSPFVRWSAYLEQYANSEQTGEVVQFVPGRGGVLPLPPSYVVRFPLPALPWSVASALEWGASPFFVHGTDVDENAGDNPGEEQVPPGGWRLTRRGAERLPAGQNELLLEVPYDQLYVDVAAQNGQNPFVAGVAEALRYE
mmetsp:Transcript_13841/g.34120  ORF Transcript_13841/g.34120 Transcript_13841/m.34120 type:complete len:466 (+) Transcript_13841:237-1634(+)|eukprot:CAMPEP_0179002214 /NCGR_PEP_ID=MMETSP0795-20121207/11855_1 /TAXON_ID=88552 /ORGANISM="Amoebophrya sp., Strain Ameob2" /LENGTH=465 /DNA_ID=CAMNT_0020695801 /DNA_START=156 /DNA_END=1553 /DNA_ORIENTATION=-